MAIKLPQDFKEFLRSLNEHESDTSRSAGMPWVITATPSQNNPFSLP